MDLIQFRVHPGAGTARIGPSTDWYFLGPEIPRFLQEQYPKLRPAPILRRHPATTNPAATQPDPDRYRDLHDNLMPQAARFRVYAYFYNRGDSDPYRVMEMTTGDCDIEWQVEIANVKAVKNVGGTDQVDPNTPGPRTLSTKDATPPTTCQSGTLPNLAHLALEKDSTGNLTGRLHVIGNEGNADGPHFTGSPPSLYQRDWQDPAADGSVMATVELKTAFTSRFADFKYLAYGQKDPVSLPADRKVLALPAWVVVNVPDYLPDMGHFVSLWDLALGQAWKWIMDRNATSVDGQHHLAVEASDVHSYDFFDYYTHIQPLLGLFADVAYVSGQARAGSFKGLDFTNGIVFDTVTNEAIAAGDGALKVDVDEAVQLKVASLGDPFLLLLSSDEHHPLSATHEFVRCTAVDNDGTLRVDRGQQGTSGAAWPGATRLRAITRAGFRVASLRADVSSADTSIKIDVQSAYKMPTPALPDGKLRDGPFKIGITSGNAVEWLTCTANPKTQRLDQAQQYFCELTVTRGIDGTSAQDWSASDADLEVVVPATGHKKLEARAQAAQLANGPRGALHQALFGRVRKPGTVYDRTDFRKFSGGGDTPAPETVYPRQFGRRTNHDTVDTGPRFAREVNIDPAGSLSRFHEIFTARRGTACHGKPLQPDEVPGMPGVRKKLPANEEGENSSATDVFGTSPDDHVTKLDDYYWIVSAADMPLLKEYALTHVQYRQFEFWATGKVAKGHEPRWAPLFEVLFKGSQLEKFLQEDGHTLEERFDRLLTCRPLFAPAFLDMASMGKMLGGSFLPGIEVGREAGKPGNWSLYRGGTKYFPDLRFHPQGRTVLHRPGTLTKDLAIPWFVDYIDCDETFWPTSRPQTVYQDDGLPYPWIGDADVPSGDEDALRNYWKKVGFIRRQANDVLVEKESMFTRP